MTFLVTCGGRLAVETAEYYKYDRTCVCDLSRCYLCLAVIMEKVSAASAGGVPWWEGGFRCVPLIGMKLEKQFLALVIRLHSWVMFVFAKDPRQLLV